jgi:hypothetical protein
MHPEEREATEIMIEDDPIAPAHGVVTPLATCALLSRMGIICPVARNAGRLELLLTRIRSMAALAGEIVVPPLQGELRLPVVIEGHSFPAAAVMAAGAVESVSAAVHVVGCVARDASGVQVLLFEWARVAGSTFYLRMPVPKREPRLSSVIEEGAVPALGLVATSAIPPELPSMHVVCGVAGPAPRGRSLIALACMAELTCDLCMPAVEWELRSAMIEFRLGPGALHMAAVACRAQALPVWVVVGMAVDTRAGRLPMLLVDLVASTAGDTLVPSMQSVVGEPMVEGLGVQANDVSRAPFVVRVTVPAQRALHSGRPPVETLAAIEIRGDVFMASEA